MELIGLNVQKDKSTNSLTIHRVFDNARIILPSDDHQAKEAFQESVRIITLEETRIQSIKEAINQKYAWPGGYPLYLVTNDGAVLCMNCGCKEWELIEQATREKDSSGWCVEGVDTNWEDPSLYCDHCNKRIESAYAEDQAEKE